VHNDSIKASGAPLKDGTYSIERSTKQQFAKLFRRHDWPLFKNVADCYLKQAAYLRKKNVVATEDLALLVRNSQKRLLIGVGVELLVKALYLKLGYAINKPSGPKRAKAPLLWRDAEMLELKDDDTFTLGELIEWLDRVMVLNNRDTIDHGLRIAKVFRNKEAHIVTSRHAFKVASYRQIESALRELYRQGFGESLRVRFSLGPTDRPAWRIGASDCEKKSADSGSVLQKCAAVTPSALNNAGRGFIRE